MKDNHIPYCRITASQLLDGDNVSFTGSVWDFNDFAKDCLKFLGVRYPKFHKMDNLSKMAFLGTEALLKGLGPDHSNADVGLIFFNKTSSLDTDLKHQHEINHGVGSPAIFVYTLPNIPVGEISIRHGIHAESLFFVVPEFDPEAIFMQLDIMFKESDLNCILVAWVDFLESDYEGHFFLIRREQFNQLNTDELTNLYHKVYK